MRKEMMTGAYGFGAFFAAVVAIGVIIFGLSGFHKPLLPAIVFSLFLAVVTPVTIIAIRHQVRLTRIKLINLFGKTFELSTTPPQAEPIGGTSDQKGRTDVVAFEFLKGKYYVDLDVEEKDFNDLRRVPRFPMMTHADWMLLLCSMPFVLFAGIGMFLMFAPFIELLHFNDGIFKNFIWTSTFTVGGAPSNIIDGSRPLFEGITQIP